MPLDKNECRAMMRCITEKPKHRLIVFSEYILQTNSAEDVYIVDDGFVAHHDRYLRKLIHAMKQRGAPIGTCTDGYYHITKKTVDLLKKEQRQIKSRMAAEQMNYNANERIIKNVSGQRRIKFESWWRE